MDRNEEFEREVERVRASGKLGRSGRLLELFDFLATRPAGGASASQAEIAQEVFGQIDAEADDATARVYIHRLRKRLDQFYVEQPAGNGRLAIPAGSYELVVQPPVDEPADEPLAVPVARPRRRWLVPLALVALLALAFVTGRELRPSGAAESANAIWQPFLESDRPIMVVVGDYYIFGELDPFDPDRSRLIRDFGIDSPTDLARAQEADPARYEKAEDVALNYLPVSSAYALEELMPVLARHPKPVGIMAASEVTSQTLRDHNIVYVGLVSGMHLLEDVSFMNSGLAVGANYDELIDVKSGRRFASDEAFSLASARYYNDWGVLARFHEPGGALVAVVAGARDTGLRGLAPEVAAAALPEQVEDLAGAGRDFEAVFEVTGQQGADLGTRLALAAPRASVPARP
ncbi:hypothetical protein [Tsuneonella sp. HG222]